MSHNMIRECIGTFFLFALSVPALVAQESLEAQIQNQNRELELLQGKMTQIQTEIEDLKLQVTRRDLLRYGLPKLAPDEKLIQHAAMCLVYSEEHEQARWVAHMILPDVIQGNYGRSNDFRPDPMIASGSAIEQDYFLKELGPDSNYIYDGFGYDRGHLAPSADFRWSPQALSESYFYSNMSPQVPALNREGWAELENMLREYVRSHPQAPLYVVTGPVLEVNLPKIARSVNGVSIPKQYFKVIVDLAQKKGIAFLVPNDELRYPIEHYAMSIKDLEKITGLDFYEKLDGALEAEIEGQKDPKWWLPDREKEDVSPLDPLSLPRNTFNTIQAKLYANSGEKIKVRGTVVSSKLSSKGNIFLNLDKKFPNQVFTVTIFSREVQNFSYAPQKVLLGKEIEVTGKISDFNGVPSMVIDSEKLVEIIR